MDKARVLEFAEKRGYTHVERVDDWNGYEVWEPYTEGGAKIGLPFVILVKGERMRMSTQDEAFERLDDLPDD